MIECIKNEMLHDIVEEINASLSYSIICDETTDISSHEQVSICIRYIVKEIDSVKIKERFLGFVEGADTTGDNLYRVIKTYIQNVGLSINKMRGQAYDGASNMSGQYNG